MKFFTFFAIILLVSVRLAIAQQALITPTSSVMFPALTDSNSPALRVDGQIVVYNSGGSAIRSSGPTQFTLGETQPVVFESSHHPYWIEATWLDDDGTIFAWYHHEPAGVCGAVNLTAPMIGALVSTDGGFSFRDLGIVLESGYPIDCSSQNGYFAGGNGDFSVVRSRNGKYFYFLLGNYSGPLDAQGVGIARMPFDRRTDPVGAVQKYYNGDWLEPGLGGHITAIFPAKVSWISAGADAFWGPSVHWNSYLRTWVMLLNHSCCSPGWPQEGVYVSFNDNLADPKGWSAPAKLMDGVGWYPQVIGFLPDGTDKLAGQTSRLYAGGVSNWIITFTK